MLHHALAQAAAQTADLTKGHLATADYVILVGYFILMGSIGIYFFKYMKKMKDYFTGANTIPWWLSAVSFYMSSFSVFAFVSTASLGYRFGCVAITLILLCVWGTVFGVIFFARKWRRARITSPVEYLESRYNPVVRQLFAWEGLPVRIIDDALKLVALGAFVSRAVGISLEKSILISTLVILANTMAGGLWAVMVMDFMQFIVLLAALLVLNPLAIQHAGGISNMFSGFPEGFFNFTHAPEFDTLYIVGGVLLYILSYGSVNWALIQRYYCVPTERDAKKVGWFVTLLFILCQPLIVLPVILSHKFLALPAGDDKFVYVTLCMNMLPAGMMGLVIAAMFAATISMLSGDYNVCASVVTNDVYRRYIRPHASQKELVLAGRLSTLVIGLISLGVAYSMIHLNAEGLFRTMMKLFGIFTAPVALPMVLGLLFKKASSRGSLCGFGLGVITGLAVFFLYKYNIMVTPYDWLGLHWQEETVLLFATTITTAIGMYFGSLAFPQRQEEIQRVDEFFKRLDVPIGQMEEDITTARDAGTKTISPFRVVGICISLTSVLLLIVLPFMERNIAFYIDLGIAIALMGVGLVMAHFSRKAPKNPVP